MKSNSFIFVITCILIGLSIVVSSAFVIDDYSITLYWIGSIILVISLSILSYYFFRWLGRFPESKERRIFKNYVKTSSENFYKTLNIHLSKKISEPKSNDVFLIGFISGVIKECVFLTHAQMVKGFITNEYHPSFWPQELLNEINYLVNSIIGYNFYNDQLFIIILNTFNTENDQRKAMELIKNMENYRTSKVSLEEINPDMMLTHATYTVGETRGADWVFKFYEAEIPIFQKKFSTSEFLLDHMEKYSKDKDYMVKT